MGTNTLAGIGVGIIPTGTGDLGNIVSASVSAGPVVIAANTATCSDAALCLNGGAAIASSTIVELGVGVLPTSGGIASVTVGVGGLVGVGLNI